MTSAARRWASRSPSKMRHVVILLRGGSIVAVGVNHDGRHAEQVALGKLWPSKRRGCRFVSLRFRRDGSLAMARPCPECEELLIAAGITCGEYSDESGDVVRCRLGGEE